VKAGWTAKRFGDLCAFEKVQGMHKNLPYVGLEDIASNTGQFIGSKNNQLVKSATFKFTTQSILYGRLRPYLNKALLPDFDGHCSTEIFPIKPIEGVTREFLFYWLTSEATMQEINKTATGARMPRANMNAVLDFELLVPPRSGQQRIVAILDEAFEGIATAKANAEKNLQNARAVFESYLQAIFSRSGSGWVEKPLGEICTFSSGGTPTKDNSSYWSGEIPWISGRDMKSTRLSDSHLHISRTAVDEASTRMAPAGTLLILVRGMGLAHGAQIGELMVPCAFNQDIKGIHPEPGLIPRYLLFAIRDRINSSSNVLSNAAHGTLKIDSAELKNLMIPVRSNSDQRRVVATIDSLSEETQHLESLYQQKLAALDELKKSLLHQAFSGEL
jgi:type I restriction enzyme, S subunit